MPEPEGERREEPTAATTPPTVRVEDEVQEAPNPYLPENMKTWKLIFSKKMIILLNGGFFIVLLTLFIILFTNNANLSQTILDYTKCKSSASTSMSAPDSSLNTGISKWMYTPANNTCTIQFQVATTFNPAVHMYIRITNFYQNHLYYVKSQDPGQLKGTMYATASSIPSASSSATNDCGWLLHGKCSEATASYESTGLTLAQHNPDCRLNNSLSDSVIANAASGSQYYPCGLAANSMFSDEISELTYASIAWPEDGTLYGKTAWATSSNISTMLIPPPVWRRAWADKWGNGYNASNLPDLGTWYRFHVWMRKAAQPTFRKLWGINYTHALNSGSWQVSVTDTWNATRFGGTKSLVFADIGILGPQSTFLWIVVLTFCVQCLLFTVVATVWNPRENGNLDSLSWKKEQ